MTFQYDGKCYPCRRLRCLLCEHTDDNALADCDAITHVITYNAILLKSETVAIERAFNSKSLKFAIYYQYAEMLPTFSITLRKLRLNISAGVDLAPLACLTNLTSLSVSYDNNYDMERSSAHVLPQLSCSIVDLSIRFRTRDIDAQTMDISSISVLSRLTSLNAARVFVRNITLPSTITHLTDEYSDFSVARLAQTLPALKYIKSDYSGELTLPPTVTLREYLVSSTKMLNTVPAWANSVRAEGYFSDYTPIGNIPRNSIKLMYRGKFEAVYSRFNLPELCDLEADIDDVDLAQVASHFPKLHTLTAGPIGYLTTCNIRIDNYMTQITTLKLTLSRQECDIDLRYVPNLEVLSLTARNIPTKTISLKGLTRLVNLSVNSVVCGDYTAIYDNVAIEEIVLSNCGGITFDNRIRGLTKLRNLYISLIESLILPECLGYMRSLRTVNISYIGRHLYIPQSICRLRDVAEMLFVGSPIDPLSSMHAIIATTKCLDVTKMFASPEDALMTFNAPICPSHCTCPDHFLARMGDSYVDMLPRDVVDIVLAYATERICDRVRRSM